MFKKLMERIARVEKYLLAITMSVTLALTFANVVGRFVFNHSLAFADELVTEITRTAYSDLFSKGIMKEAGNGYFLFIMR